jgi:hypothetical protein
MNLLPDELLANVIRHAPDLDTLKACACVNSRWNWHAEPPLWRSVDKDITDLYDESSLLPEGATDPFDVFKFVSQLDPELLRDEDLCIAIYGPTGPAILRTYARRCTSARHISLTAPYNPDGGGYPSLKESGFLAFVPAFFAVLPNLETLTVDGALTQRVWDALLKLSPLRELNIWRCDDLRHPLSRFGGLSQLKALRLGKVLHSEAFALGDAVRESHLTTLHIKTTNIGIALGGENTLDSLFAGLLRGHESTEGPVKRPGTITYGFPSSLTELAIEDDHER